MYLLDANVLIDYKDSDLNILSLFSLKIGKIIVPEPIVTEAKVLPETVSGLGLEIYQPETSDLIVAYQKRRGLSWQDHLCFHLAQKYGWVCVTSEKLLRGECEQHGITTIRALRLLIELYENKHIDAQKALTVALKIQQTNPYITLQIIQEFCQIIGLAPSDGSEI